MSHATEAANGNGTEYSVSDEVRAALQEMLGVKVKENVPYLNYEPIDDSEMPLGALPVNELETPAPGNTTPTAVVHIRLERARGFWDAP